MSCPRFPSLHGTGRREGRLEVDVLNGAFRDWLGPHDARVYRFALLGRSFRSHLYGGGMRPSASVARRVWRVAAGTGAALETAAIAWNVMARSLQPGTATKSQEPQASDAEQLALVREIEACDVRLRLLPAFDSKEFDASLRRELQERRDNAAARLMRSEQTSL